MRWPAAALAVCVLLAGCGSTTSTDASRSRKPRAVSVLRTYESRVDVLVQAGLMESLYQSGTDVGTEMSTLLDKVSCHPTESSAQDHDGVPDRFSCEILLSGRSKPSRVTWEIDGPRGTQVGVDNPASFDPGTSHLPTDDAEAMDVFARLAFAITGVRPSAEPEPGRSADASCNGPIAISRDNATFACNAIFRDKYGGAAGGTYRLTFTCDGSAQSSHEASDALMSRPALDWQGRPASCPVETDGVTDAVPSGSDSEAAPGAGGSKPDDAAAASTASTCQSIHYNFFGKKQEGFVTAKDTDCRTAREVPGGGWKRRL